MTELGSGGAAIEATLQSKPRVSAVNCEALPCSMLYAMSSLEDILSSLINLFEVLVNWYIFKTALKI